MVKDKDKNHTFTSYTYQETNRSPCQQTCCLLENTSGTGDRGKAPGGKATGRRPEKSSANTQAVSQKGKECNRSSQEGHGDGSTADTLCPAVLSCCWVRRREQWAWEKQGMSFTWISAMLSEHVYQ